VHDDGLSLLIGDYYADGKMGYVYYVIILLTIEEQFEYFALPLSGLMKRATEPYNTLQ